MSPPQPQPETPITPLTATALENLLSPLLLSLPTSTVAPSAPTALLPLLSPILRQRVQYLSSASNEPWLPLLSYDTSATSISKLKELAESEKIEPHPVSQEIEIDWDHDVSVKYRRVDQETLHAIVGLQHFGLGARCIWCVGDTEGGGDGWRIGELILFPTPETELSKSSIAEAEAAFKSNNNTASKKDKDGYLIITNGATEQAEAIEEDDDDDYWAQYDNTPARTPGPEMNGGSSSAQQPASMVFGGGRQETQEDEDNYYAQYATVQPSMDQHDPDTEVPPGIESSLNHHHLQNGNSHEIRRELDSHPELTSTSSAWETAHGESQLPLDIRQPRPGSSSSGEDTVARLEREAEKRSEGSGSSREEMGVKQHIGTSIKSLYRLARVAGIDRAEFERLIHTELECLSLMDEDD